MVRSPLEDAFTHHTWATLRLIDACAGLTPEQLDSSVPGTYGTIIATLRHLVGGDSWYRYRLLGDRYPPISEEEESRLDVPAMRALAEEVGRSWAEAFGRDPGEMIVAKHEDGSETHATVGLRLAQALHHGSDHRSQICTALTQIGIEPPGIDLWEFGTGTGRVTEVPPSE
jgi:uncharacterized damage-inducible protein DinB